MLSPRERQYWPNIEEDKVREDLRILSNAIRELEDFEPILVDDDHFPKDITPAKRYHLLNNIGLAAPV